MKQHTGKCKEIVSEHTNKYLHIPMWIVGTIGLVAGTIMTLFLIQAFWNSNLIEGYITNLTSNQNHEIDGLKIFIILLTPIMAAIIYLCSEQKRELGILLIILIILLFSIAVNLLLGVLLLCMLLVALVTIATITKASSDV